MDRPLTDRMYEAILRISDGLLYYGLIPQCEGLCRRRLATFERGRALGHGYVLTPAGEDIASVLQEQRTRRKAFVASKKARQ